MFILVLPVVVFADNEAEIKSIEFIEKSEGTVVVNEASTDGVKVNLDLIFHDVNDYASYKIILKNNTGTSLYINDDIFNSSKEYINRVSAFVVPMSRESKLKSCKGSMSQIASIKKPSCEYAKQRQNEI